MRIVIGGCRDFNDDALFSQQVSRILASYPLSETVFLSGHCSGADELAERYASEHGIQTELYPADWQRYGRAAGPIRNEQMVMQADCVIAFWDGKSRGTKSLISFAQKHNKILYIVYI